MAYRASSQPLEAFFAWRSARKMSSGRIGWTRWYKEELTSYMERSMRSP
jgi:hypothetical protein